MNLPVQTGCGWRVKGLMSRLPLSFGFLLIPCSQEDLLARAAEIGGQLRATSEGLETLKAEVVALRRSIR